MKKTRVLIAPNAFKHSLSATEAAHTIREGLERSNLPCECECFPVGDGGDGTGELMIHKLNGSRKTIEVLDPFGRKIRSSFGVVNNGQTAVIEMASASGIQLVKPEELDPLRASSYGTGQLMSSALDEGVTEIVLAIGGSATVDGGTGILRALGMRFLGAQNEELTTPESLLRLARIDTSALDPRLAACPVTLLCDVENTLLGEEGSAAVFGPQKGATPDAVRQLDACLAKLAEITQLRTGIDMASVKHGGAAGGVAAGLFAFLGARLVKGIDFFLGFTGFAEAVAKADIVITGEGSLDEQTLHGKGPYGVAQQAKSRHLPVIGLAGNIPLTPNEQLNRYFDCLLAIGNGPVTLTVALQDTRQNLLRTAWQLGNLIAASNRQD